MNNAKMWLVVPPAVGVPVFLGAVAVGSFAVHVAVLSNTSWVSDFLSGQELGSGDMEAAARIAPEANTAKASYAVERADGSLEVTIILPDGRSTTALIQAPPLQPEL
ncbi:light-harvesting protein [Marivita hallyeonensis]|uniref:Antenna pigment protein alpha chain n=1 Tax=Marivita hallyeonensis TaxID=996342 RepID=A0A1M5VVX6_9RHOB|nr:light-harvesting protein [Marivita hallyeonensis]SHH79347.1 light-harvesting protein B-800-850 alpha chain [Marivita hallyeonensis]